MSFTRLLGAAGFAGALLAGAAAPGLADDSLKIGLMLTLSGPPAVLGQHARDGFQLALEQMDNAIGGLATELVVVDDELKPDLAVDRARALVERDQVDFVVGTIFSNVLGAIFRPVTETGTILISPNAGPSPFAGEACSENFFVTSYQNDQVHEVLGQYAQDAGISRMILIAPNYQAGFDAIAGVKRHFEGEVVDEIYTQLGQADYSAEIARIAAAQPEAIFVFLPGGMGVNFVRQWEQSGLKDTIKFLSAFTVDETTLPAVQTAALGLYGAADWAPGLENERNQAFVAAFEERFGYVPGTYAAHAYDAAYLIDSAVRAVGGNLDDRDALRAAIRAADFQSVRGEFRFNTNGYPVQDFYLLSVAERTDGKFQTEVAQQVFDDYGDVYAAQCPLN